MKSSKERVLAEFPGAWEHPDTHFILDIDGNYLADSWEEAARIRCKLPSSPAGEMGSEPVRKVLTRADIEKLNEGTHSCGWTTGAVKNPNPACGCMCGTVYAPDGRAILSHSGRYGMRCQHADERGNLLVPKPLGADISGPKGSGGAAPEAKCANCRDYEANIREWIEQLGGNPDVQHISLELERLIDAVAPRPAAPIAPAAQELVQELVTALRNVVNGNDLALERQQSIENWRDSDFRRQALAALARAERKEQLSAANELALGMQQERNRW